MSSTKSKILKKYRFFERTYPKLNPGWGHGSFVPTKSCFLLEMDLKSILHNEPSILRSKIRKKTHFMFGPTQNSTLDRVRGHFYLQNLVSRLKLAHKVFYTKNLACIGQKLEKKPIFWSNLPQTQPWVGSGVISVWRILFLAQNEPIKYCVSRP